jgi:uncharacterized glyoxalase superfamily protein PhnB
MADAFALKSLAPILLVERIEPCLPFWVERLGFALVTTVPEASPFAFAIVARGGVEIMLQTSASAAEDMGGATASVRDSIVYLSVDALEPVLAAIGDAEIVVPRRTTFYGADEIWVRDPAGTVVGFSASPG